MSSSFKFDVFVSYSSKDKSIVRPLAERLLGDGLRVWFDEWELKPGDSVSEKIEDGLERSRILLFCMSTNTFGEDWPQLEAGTFRFRDPQNSERRFIPLRLDEAPIKDSLAKFLYINWQPEHREQEYERLLEACRLSVEPARSAAQEAISHQFTEWTRSLGHAGTIRSVAFSPDGRFALSAGSDKTVRLWEVESGKALQVLEGHTSEVNSVAFSPDERFALSGGYDGTVRIWEVKSGRPLRVLEGHERWVMSVAFSPDASLIVSGSADQTVRLWQVESGRELRILKGHTRVVGSVAFGADGSWVASSSDDKTVRIWETKSGRLLRVLEGHTRAVRAVALSANQRLAVSGGDDNTVRLWEVESGRSLRMLEGHTGRVFSVAFSADGRQVLSGGDDTTVRLWDVASGQALRVLNGHTGYVNSVSLSQDGNLALSGGEDKTVRLWELESGRELRELGGHTASTRSFSFSSDGRLALSGGEDTTVRLWEVESGQALRVLKGHTGYVNSVSFSPDGRLALSGGEDKTVWLWEVESGRPLRVLEGHKDRVSSVAFSPDGRLALSGAHDNTMRLWEVESGQALRVLKGHTGYVNSVSFSPDGRLALSGADDNTVRLWEVESGKALRMLEGHKGRVSSVAFSPDGRLALSGAHDRTVRLWEVKSGKALQVLEGHTSEVNSVAFSPDERFALSGGYDGTVRIWEVKSGRPLRVLKGHQGTINCVAFSSDRNHFFSSANNAVWRSWRIEDAADPTFPKGLDNIQYTNAKVLLVGESGAGKTGLSQRLALNLWTPSDSTVGAWATQWKLPLSPVEGVEREIWLWDFGGQADQRLIHQLYMEDTAVAVLVFDGQKEDLFETLGQWDRDLVRASRRPFTKLLTAGRVDAGGLRSSRSRVERFAKERGFDAYIETSAKANIGCEELKEKILAGIRWSEIPFRSSPRLFKRLKEEILRLKDANRCLMRFNELRDALRLRLTGYDRQFTDQELKAVLGLLAGPGVVWELAFGSWVLLQPERINAYAQAVIQTLRGDEHERGSIREEQVLSGELKYYSSAERLQKEEERFVLLAMHQTLVERSLCLREHTEQGPVLIFPSYYRRERPELAGHPAVLVSYKFNGFLDDIYATLVVRLHHTKPFNQDQLWRYAADFKTLTGKQLGVKLTRKAEGAGELDVYFDPLISVEEKIIFSRYVHEHLLQKGRDVVRLRHYVCPHCYQPIAAQDVAMRKLNSWLEQKASVQSVGDRVKALFTNPEAPSIICSECENRVPLWDDLEQSFASEKVRQRVHELQQESIVVLDAESKERALVGEVISTVALAGQLCREFNVSDHGIDMEIEFKSNTGEATGRRLYLQLKSGDSYLTQRERDGAEIFHIKKVRWVQYWQMQAYPVMLVIRSSQGEIRWMDVTAALKRAGGEAKQLTFEGERFDVMSIRRWRDKMLKG